MIKRKKIMLQAKSNHGFSLIELMIVLAIVGILTAIAVPSYTQQVRKAKRTDGVDALLNCSAEQARYYSSKSPPTYLNSAQAQSAGIATCGWDGTNFISSEGNYTLAITNPGCTGGNSLWCFNLTATAIGGQVNDTSCASMSVDHRGIKSSLDSDGNDSTSICWRT